MPESSILPIPDQTQFFAVLILVITAAFVASRWIKPPFGRWWRRTVIIAYLLAFGLAIVWTLKWLVGS
jgi:threonine/homoserine/homoserine lactone efflux protein